MTARYAIVVARGEPPSQAICPPLDQVTVLETGTLTVLAGVDAHIITFMAASGALVGDVYHRQGPMAPVPEIDGRTEAALVDDDFEPLLSSYWGSYVGAVQTSGGIVIFRDPSATCPCYFAETDERVIFASDVRTLLVLLEQRGAVDWDGIAQYLYGFGFPSTETALAGIFELLPGTRILIEKRQSARRYIWSPWNHVATRQGASLAKNTEALRRTVHSCVGALTRKFKRPLVSVSGGLDSSIIAACVSGSGVSPAGLTMFTDDPAGDERSYSKILCDAFGYELIACRYDLGAIDIDEPLSPHLPRPIGRTQGMAYERALLAHATIRNADGFLTGNGGDNVFANLKSAKPILDRYLTEGWTSGVWTTMRDVADLTGVSYWQVGKAVLKAFRSRAEGYQWKVSTRFLHPDLIAARANFPLEHEWLVGSKSALPGHFLHIAGILRIQQSLEPGRAAFAPVVSPLLAQPIMELCLSIPTWQWCAGGRDRAVARAAFGDMLPAPILDRRVKGTPDSFSAQIIDHRQHEIRERLLDGHLAGHGLLDRPSLELVLGGGAPTRPEDRPRLLDLLDTEAWLNHWLGASALGVPK